VKYNYDAIVFDFDGVLVESVDIKTQAFRALYKNYNKQVIDEIVSYHLTNGGVNRYDKFRYIHNKILGQQLEIAEENKLCNEFSYLVEDLVVAAKWVQGAFEFITKYHQILPLHISSATPVEELLRITKKRKMDQYFLTITGSPKPKNRTLVEICESTGCNSKRVLMIGDSYSDFDAAKHAKTSFVGLVPNQLFSPFPASVHLIKDLNTLPILINN